MVDLNEAYKSVLEADKAAVVICDLEHTIIYMNPTAINRYEKWGGKRLIGQSLLNCHNDKSREMIIKVLDWFKASKDNNIVLHGVILMNRMQLSSRARKDML